MNELNRPNPEIYEKMGEANIFAMILDFYHELAQSSIRDLFPTEEEGLEEGALKSGRFFVGLLGGPPLYHLIHGPPRMRARHFQFPIDQEARDEWVACFDRVLDRAVEKYAFPEEHLVQFQEFLHTFAQWMVNREKKE